MFLTSQAIFRTCVSLSCLMLLPLAGCKDKDEAAAKPVDNSPPICTPFLQKVVAGTKCANEGMCRDFGYCGSVNGVCWPTVENHCACSARCKSMGACSLREIPQGERRLYPGRTHMCGAVSQKDCAQSDECKFKERCTIGKSGNCVDKI